MQATLTWSRLPPHELILVFVELYHLFGKRVEEYLEQPDQEKAIHRHSMGHMMLANQSILSQAYQLEPGLAALNYRYYNRHEQLDKQIIRKQNI